MTYYEKVRYLKKRLESELNLTDVVEKNELRIYTDVYLSCIESMGDRSFETIQSDHPNKKFELLICSEKDEVLLAVSIYDQVWDHQGYRIPTLDLDMEQLWDENSMGVIACWIEKKLNVVNNTENKYGLKRYRKRIQRISLEQRLRRIEDEYI